MVEARAGIEPAIKVLQTSALPLGYLAISHGTKVGNPESLVKRFGERVT